jgi:uncharacterized protein (DUF1501 family)
MWRSSISGTAVAVDFRSLYATVLERWWGLPSFDVSRGRFAPLKLLRAS